MQTSVGERSEHDRCAGSAEAVNKNYIIRLVKNTPSPPHLRVCSRKPTEVWATPLVSC